MNRVNVQDWSGYYAKKELIDFWLLTLANGAPDATAYKLKVKLRELGVGDAHSNDRHVLSDSSTGAIYRSAMNHLQRRGFIEDPWMHGRRLGDPLRISDAGRAYLATLPAQQEQELFA